MDLVITPVFPPRAVQDTSQGPNLLILHLGPGLVTPALQFDPDVANQRYHYDSLQGQVPDPPNLLVTHLGPPFQTIQNPDLHFQPSHRESSKGQINDPPNLVPLLQLTVNPGQVGSYMVAPVYKGRVVFDTQQVLNTVINIQTLSAAPFTPVLFEDQTRARDSLQGQAVRVTSYLRQPEPITANELHTFVFRQKTAQEPFIYPNLVIIGIAPVAPPFVQRQSEDFTYKRQPAQEPFVYPNRLAFIAKPVAPFVQASFPDLTFKRQPAQAPYDVPNVTFYTKVPANPPPLLASQSYPNTHWRGHKTQEHFDFPNLVAVDLKPPPPPAFRVTAVCPGVYDGQYREIGDVFDLLAAADFSDSTVNYGPNAATIQLGWMARVPPGTPLFSAAFAQPIPLRPVSDPVPPVRFLY